MASGSEPDSEALGDSGADEWSQSDNVERDYVDKGSEDTAWKPLHDWQPVATFDALFLADALAPQSRPSQLDFHTFAYLACLMSVFRGRPASEWGYVFSAIPPTLPFSPAIEAATADLLSRGWLSRFESEPAEGEGVAGPFHEYDITDEGRSELRFWLALSTFNARVEFLDAAGKTALFSSLPSVVNSLAYEPQLAQALRIDASRTLLTDLSSGPLYEQFDALILALGPKHHELVVPATLYVNYLNHQARVQLDALPYYGEGPHLEGGAEVTGTGGETAESKDMLVETFKKLGGASYQLATWNRHGDDGVDSLVRLFATVRDLFTHVPYEMLTDGLSVVVSVSGGAPLNGVGGMAIASLSELSGRVVGGLTVAITGSASYRVWPSQDVEVVSSDPVLIYKYVPAVREDLILDERAWPINDTPWPCKMAARSYASVEKALTEYVKQNRRPEQCAHLDNTWRDAKRLAFREKPEKFMRRSLLLALQYAVEKCHG